MMILFYMVAEQCYTKDILILSASNNFIILLIFLLLHLNVMNLAVCIHGIILLIMVQYNIRILMWNVSKSYEYDNRPSIAVPLKILILTTKIVHLFIGL